MGLLNSNSLNDYITKTIPANARSMWQGVKRIPKDLRQLTDPAFMQGLLSQPRKPLDPNEMAAMGMDYVQPMGGLLAHTVYHGSPHKFDKFDMSKIGTGEGAQAYGHGLYFAESPGVAQSYANKLGLEAKDISGRTFTFNDLASSRLQHLPDEDYLAIRGVLQSDGYDDWIEKAQSFIDSRGGSIDYKTREAAKKLLGAKYLPETSKSNLYKVDIPDESIPRMLDWDKPLSEQGPEVLNAIQRAAELRAKQTGGAFAPIDMSQKGSDVIPTLGEGRLKQAGIPGIRYLDGMSRGQGGTSNFVLFDDQLPRILEVNGQPTGLLSYADEAKKTKKAKK